MQITSRKRQVSSPPHVRAECEYEKNIQNGRDHDQAKEKNKFAAFPTATVVCPGASRPPSAECGRARLVRNQFLSNSEITQGKRRTWG